MMECTPPISPTRSIGEESIKTIHGLGNVGFHCDVERATKDLSSSGFLMNGDGDLEGSSVKYSGLDDCFVSIFDHVHDIDNSCAKDLENLFRVARNKICYLESALKANKGTYGLLTGVADSNDIADFNQIRKSLREFYFMLRVLIDAQSNQRDSYWVLDQLRPCILEGLMLIRSQLGWLTDLPSYVLNYAHVRGSTKTTSGIEMSQVSEILQMHGADSNLATILQSSIELCMSELLDMAASKFNKLDPESIVQSSVFSCTCVKELWLLLRFICGSSKSFWNLIDGLLANLGKERKPNSTQRKRKRLSLPDSIACKNPSIFTLWLLKSIGELFTYSKDGRLLSHDNVLELESGHLTLKQVLSNVQTSDIDESERRVLVTLVNCLISDPWKPRPEPIMMLWEGFSRNLNSPFQLPGALASSYAISNETTEDILKSVTSEAVKAKSSKTNSYDMFVILLGKYLKSDSTQWKSKMSGRFLSKLSEKKVNGLTETGLYHLSQLFITIAHQTDLVDLAMQFQKLVCFSDNNENRNVMVMKARLCFVFLFVQAGKPIAPIVLPLIERLHSFFVTNQILVLQAFVANLQYIVKSCDYLPPDMNVVCEGGWITNFLKGSQELARNMLNVMVNVMKKIRTQFESSNAASQEIEKLVHVLREHLLPFVKENKHSHLEQIADLAVYFSILALELNIGDKDAFQSLLQLFMSSESSHMMFLRRYISEILSYASVRAFVQEKEYQQILFIQAWIRCCTLSNMGQDFGKYIFSMPLMKNFINVDLTLDDDPLGLFIETCGRDVEKSTSNRKVFLSFIEPWTRLISTLKSSLFPPKPKDVNWKIDKTLLPQLPKDVIVRVFCIFGKLMYECSSFIYEKNTTSKFLTALINGLILNPAVLNFDNRLPLPMEEGLRKSLHLYLRGLHKLDPSKEKCIQRFIDDIVKHYVPRFGANPENNPFTKIWDEPEHMPTDIYLIKVLCNTLLSVDKITNTPHKFYIQGLHLVRSLTRKMKYDETFQSVLIENVLPACLFTVERPVGTNVIFMKQKEETIKTFKLLFEVGALQSNSTLWEQTNSVLNTLSDKYLKENRELFFRMLKFLVKDFKVILEHFMPTLRENVKNIIVKSGCGSNNFWETQLATLEAAISAHG